MRYFLGIKPPATLVESVLKFRGELNQQGLEPHITIKAPCGLNDELDWLPVVRSLCQRIPPFPIEVSGISSFGNAVLFLQVTSPSLTILHNSLLNELKTSAADQDACYEGARYTPHLTLTQHLQSQNDLPIAEELTLAARYFNESVLFTAVELTVYCKSASGSYQGTEKIPFAGHHFPL